MYDKQARHIIEALRSGIPSRAVGQYFSEARPKIMREISDRLLLGQYRTVLFHEGSQV